MLRAELWADIRKVPGNIKSMRRVTALHSPGQHMQPAVGLLPGGNVYLPYGELELHGRKPGLHLQSVQLDDQLLPVSGDSALVTRSGKGRTGFRFARAVRGTALLGGLLALLGCGSSASSSPATFATEGTGTWKALPSAPSGLLDWDPQLFWSGVVLTPEVGAFGIFNL